MLLTTDTLLNAPGEGSLAAELANVTIASGSDPGVPRYRPMLIPSEQGDATITTDQGGDGQPYPVTRQRVQWEINRRAGRSQVIELTCDSWRDTGGLLWAVNTLAPVSLPALKATPSEPWLIVEVVFRRDESGPHADIVLMPPGAFAPEPIVLNPIASSIAQAVNQGGATNVPVSDVPSSGGLF